MNRIWRAGAWVVAIAGLVAGVAAALVPMGSTGPEIPRPRRHLPVPASREPYPADSFARVAVGRNLFRTTRRPPPTAYDAQALVAAANAPPTPKPVLALVGIVAGHEPTAVIEGFPGTDGPRVVREGERVAGLRVTRIGRTEVRIAGLDTVWVLHVREPWR